jgi:hypothetical protein
LQGIAPSDDQTLIEPGSWNDPSENTHNASREFWRATISFYCCTMGIAVIAFVRTWTLFQVFHKTLNGHKGIAVIAFVGDQRFASGRA